MKVRHPDIKELTSRCEDGAAVLISAPYYSRAGLEWVRPNAGGHVEFWTRFNPRDWAAGVADPPALLRYLEDLGEERVSLRVHRALHAKIYQVDAWAWIGYPNLTRAAFTNNIELVAELNAEETESLENVVNGLRSRLRELPVPIFRAYIEASQDVIQQTTDSDVWTNDDFQAAVEIADEYLSAGPALKLTVPMPPLSDFISFIDPMGEEVPQTILDHHRNLSRQQRQSHVKQSYYALIQFLSNSPGYQYVSELITIPLDDYPGPRLSLGFVEAWVTFLDEHATARDNDLGYSFSTLRKVLPEHMGGYLTTGGGGIGTFTRMVPLVARFLSK